jgi:hypothetical protein
VTALALSLAYVATLAFAAFVLWFRARHRETVRDMAVKAAQVANATKALVDKLRPGWDDAARYVEGQNISKGLGPRRSA